jgi:hypothetical protein
MTRKLGHRILLLEEQKAICSSQFFIVQKVWKYFVATSRREKQK